MIDYQMGYVDGGTSTVLSPYMVPVSSPLCPLYIIICSRMHICWIISDKTSRCSGILGRTITCMKIPFGYKGTKNTGFSCTTIVLEMGLNMMPYVKKSAHMSLCSVMAPCQEVIRTVYVTFMSVLLT